MGAGIAHVLAAGGSEVALYDPDPGALERALASIRAAAAALGRDVEDLIDRLTPTTELALAVDSAEFVVEAGPEIPELKQRLFRDIEQLVGPDAVLASNTSAIPIRTIAELVGRRARVLGTHFWHPPHLVPLVEVVQADQTELSYVEWTMALLARRGMSPVHVRADVPGFVGNRLQHALKREAIALVHAGVCDAETLDTVVKQGFGSRLGVLGPLEQADLGGLDLTYRIHQVVMPALDNTPQPHPLLAAKIERGELGAKSGRGFRSWDEGEADALRARVNRTLLAQARQREPGTAPRSATVTMRAEAERRFGLGGVLVFLTSSDRGLGYPLVVELKLKSGSGLPLHRHPRAGELLTMIDGEIALEVDGRSVVLSAGDAVDLPPGAGYRWEVVSEHARMLIVAEGERGRFYRDVSRPADGDPAGEPAHADAGPVSDAAAGNGIELLTPPAADPGNGPVPRFSR
jgi:3-hydroxybutyryl-CoA dehydrogenase